MCSVCMLVGVAFDPCTRVNGENVLPGLKARPSTDLHMPAYRIGTIWMSTFTCVLNILLECQNFCPFTRYAYCVLVLVIQLQEQEPCHPIKLLNF